MNEDIKVINLLELAKLLYAYKLLIVCLAIIGGILGFGYAYKTVIPTYKSSIEVKLPLYCDDNTIKTAVRLAGNQELFSESRSKVRIDGDTENAESAIMTNAQLEINPTLASGTTIIHVEIKGNNPQMIKAFADIYQYDLSNYLNSFVNEKTIEAMQRANLQSANPLSNEELQKKITLGKVIVVKEAGVSTTRVDEGYEKKTILGIFLGIFFGLGIVVVKHLNAIVTNK